MCTAADNTAAGGCTVDKIVSADYGGVVSHLRDIKLYLKDQLAARALSKGFGNNSVRTRPINV